MSYFNNLRDTFSERYSKVNQDDDYYYLYKHFSYGAKDSEYEFKVLDTFNNCSLLFSKPNSFNDPYDCLSIIDYDFTGITRAELEEILKIRITNKNFKLYKEKYIKDLKSLDTIQQWGDLRRNGFHLTCFNNSPLNILMWSHYTNNHQGFMIECKFKKREKIYNHLPIPVIYSNNFPEIKYPYNAHTSMCLKNIEFGSEALIKLFSNKAECWAYENEFRLINTNDNINKSLDKVPVPIESEMFVSVIFGVKTNERCMNETRTSINTFNKKYGKNIITYKAEMLNKKYELFVPDHPRLDVELK